MVGYAANEPIQLKAQGFDVTELRVADYVQLASNGVSSPARRSSPKTLTGEGVRGKPSSREFNTPSSIPMRCMN